jgi:pyruvate/2-oxoglutarate dehydrogenase complex dihydrolipoamide dehydrogenase (E3) component
MEEQVFDVVIIGGGSAGYASARTCASGGLKTAVVDGGEELSGLCILRGCMPTKALLYAAEVLHLANTASVWGLKVPTPSFDFQKVMDRKNAMISEFSSYRKGQLGDGRFALFRAQAKFLDPHRVQLASGEIVRAKNFILSTGSQVAPSPLPALKNIDYLDSDSALKLTSLPQSIIVLGGGAIALEFAQFFLRFGVKTTVIQRSEHVLRDFDPDAARELTAALEAEGMRIIGGTKLLDATSEPGKKKIFFEKAGAIQTVEAEEIFFALGRVPNTGGLDLDKAGVQTEYGRIISTPHMQTTADHIYAAGDCTGPHEIVHIAIQQGETAAWNILHNDKKRSMDYRLLINVVFTDPQVATVGLTDCSSASKGVPVACASHPFNDHGKSMLMNVNHGLVKLLAHSETGEIVGGCCVGPSGGELIHEIVAAMAKRMNVRELASMPHYHPTLAEIWTYPAEELADKIGI